MAGGGGEVRVVGDEAVAVVGDAERGGQMDRVECAEVGGFELGSGIEHRGRGGEEIDGGEALLDVDRLGGAAAPDGALELGAEQVARDELRAVVGDPLVQRGRFGLDVTSFTSAEVSMYQAMVVADQ